MLQNPEYFIRRGPQFVAELPGKRYEGGNVFWDTFYTH